MIPKTKLPSIMKWNNAHALIGYRSSIIHTSNLPTVANNLKTILGNHLIARGVLLSSNASNEDNGTSSAYTCTTAYATLMSIRQMNDTFASNSNQYDDGEANYKLPLFNYENYWANSGYVIYATWILLVVCIFIPSVVPADMDILN